MQSKGVIELVKETFREWSEDKASRLAAALAYYTIFSIPPLLLIAIAIAGQVFGTEMARAELSNQIGQLVGPTAAEAIEQMLENASRPGGGLVATIVGIATLLFGASGVFGQLQEAMNTIWDVAPRPDRGIMGTVKDRFVSFTMVLGIGFLLLVSLVLSAALSLVGNFLEGLIPGGAVIIMRIVNLVISLGVTTLLFALIFKVIPDVEIRWRDVWVGALVTAILFTLGKEAISWYMGRFAPGSTYGAAGSLVVLLLWVYYSAQILFLGAEFTQVYAQRHGARLQPSEDAILLTEEDRLEQGIPHEQRMERKRAGQEQDFGGWQPFRSERLQAQVGTRTGALEPPGQLKKGMERFTRSTIIGLAAIVGLWRWLRGDGRDLEGRSGMRPQSTGSTVLAWFDNIEAVRSAIAELTAGTGFTRDDIDVVPRGDDATRVARLHDLEDYEEGFLLGVRALGNLDEKAIAILSRHNPMGVVKRPLSWQDQGLEGFELEPSRQEVAVIQKARDYYAEKLGEL